MMFVILVFNDFVVALLNILQNFIKPSYYLVFIEVKAIVLESIFIAIPNLHKPGFTL